MIKFIPPEKTTDQLKAKAASGFKGCVQARDILSRRLHEQLKRELAR